MQTCILAGHSQAQAELSRLMPRMPKISVYNTSKLGLKPKVNMSFGSGYKISNNLCLEISLSNAILLH